MSAAFREQACLASFQGCNISLVALPLQQEKQQEAEERRQTMLASVLQPAARERRESLIHRPGVGCLRWPSLGMQAAAWVWMQEQKPVPASL